MVIVSQFYYGKTEVYGKSLMAIEKEISVLRCHKVMKRPVSLNTLAHCVKSVQPQSFFSSVFPRIRTAYREVRNISPYSVWMQENTDQEKLRIWTLFTRWAVSTIQQTKTSSRNTLKMKQTLAFFDIFRNVCIINQHWSAYFLVLIFQFWTSEEHKHHCCWPWTRF